MRHDKKEFMIKKGAQLLLLKYLQSFDFKCTLFSKSVPNFWPSKPKRTKDLEYFYTYQVGAEAKLIHPWTKLSSAVHLRSR